MSNRSDSVSGILEFFFSLMVWYFFVIKEMAFRMSEHKVTVSNYDSPSTKCAHLYYEIETAAIKHFEIWSRHKQ